jgi:hypothetical protein
MAMMNRAHHHLIVSTPGGPPGTSDIYTSKLAALKAARDRYITEHNHGGFPWRQISTGYYVRADNTCYIAVGACMDEACITELKGN